MTNRAARAPRSGQVGDGEQAATPGQAVAGPPVATPKALDLPAALSVHELASMMSLNSIDVIKQLMRNGYMYAINDVLEFETAAMIAGSLGFPINPPKEEERGPGSLVISPGQEDATRLEPRPPVVTILGHVDHGKTTLLDAIRKSNVVVGEAGGITQHIGAYQIDHEGKPITFLDTPGHEAFTAMRARGAQVTDIAVLVVAADDGIMPQTVEAIDHVNAAGVPLIAAINKMDRPDADPERVKRQLAEHNLLIEEWGGEVIAVPMSALKGEGTSELLENILVVAEVGELNANPDRPAEGVVVEARIDKSRGPVATVLVQTGTLRLADNVVAGGAKGRIKAMLDDHGSRIDHAGPSVPVEIMGLGGLPPAGEKFTVATGEKSARAAVEAWERQNELKPGRGVGITLEEIRARIESGEAKSLELIIKTDVQGTIDAVRSAVESLGTEKARVNLIHIASGSITESDVMLALASEAIIIGFNSRPETGALTMANQESIDVRFYDVIYDLIDDVDKALKGLLTPVSRDIVEGIATVRAVFNLGKRRKAAGIHVSNGRLSRGADIHLLRDDERLFVGPIGSLKRFKDDVSELAAGLEGGIALEGFQDFQEGDILEAHRTENVAQA